MSRPNRSSRNKTVVADRHLRPTERRAEQFGALMMRSRDGLSVADIADVLALPEPQVRRGIIVAGVERGMSAAAAGRLAGVSRTRAAVIARNQGWTVDRRLDARRQKIAKLSKGGLSADEIAVRLGLSLKTVRSVRRKH
jgi:predicted ArsR family transcriptional regulator